MQPIPDNYFDDDYDYQEGHCPECGEAFSMCDCDLSDYEDLEDERPHCGCPYCHCTNPTIAGETCNQCLGGAHQG